MKIRHRLPLIVFCGILGAVLQRPPFSLSTPTTAWILAAVCLTGLAFVIWKWGYR
jgi:hypothetical protein